ncbi:hypothetical protein M1R94_08595 [Actinotalea sp. K2]|nr:hypothetical protein [Actinotalea sp. K2]
MVHRTAHYEVVLDLGHARLEVRTSSGLLVLDVPLDSAVDAWGHPEAGGQAMGELVETSRDGSTVLILEVGSDVWRRKEIEVELGADHVVYRVRVAGDGQRVLDAGYFVDRARPPGVTGMTSVYAPRFDWFDAEPRVAPDREESLGVQQWLSPPPLTYVLSGDEGEGVESVWCAVVPEPGAYDFQSFDYTGGRGPSFRLTYEAHTVVDGVLDLPALVLGFGAGPGNDAVGASVTWARDRRFLPAISRSEVPAWWSEPIFCGWGQMRYDYRRDHQGHENGNFINVTSYCTELRYRNYLTALEEAGVNPGTIVVDMGWAREAARAAPDPDRWADLRGFVNEQHARGRKVLLWFTPFVAEGLPVEACMTLGDEIVAPDPTSPVYAQILAAELHTMLSSEPGCLNADGLKIDFTQCVPSEDGRFVNRMQHFGGLINESDVTLMYPRLSTGRTSLVTTHGSAWGIEIVRRAMELVHRGAKSAKPDAMVMAHTANPYFADVVDVLRLNDLDGDCQDVLGVMSNRAALAAICSPQWLIDTDDDLMVDRDRWLAYAELQPHLGIPDTYYATGIAQSMEAIRPEDYADLRRIWAGYRESRAASRRQPQ